MGIGVYIHVPFCVGKCPYCDFYSVRYNPADVNDYVDAIIRNLRHFFEENGRVSAKSVYFGGGTPLLLSPSMIYRILSAVETFFEAEQNAEITAEANPTLSSRERLSEYRAAGLDRISFGVQSFNDDELKTLGRIHTADGARKAVENAYAAGFDNISADIMLGIIGQDKLSLENTLDTAGKLPLSHISAYMLKIEDGTRYDCGEIRKALPDEDETADLYLAAVDGLEKRGFGQYEISNFAKEGRESRHNLLYWECGDYVGFGPAAHSCFKGTRYAVPRDIRLFNVSDRQVEEMTEAHPCDFEEYAMLRLRLTNGLSLSECVAKFGADAEKILRLAEPMRENGLLNIKEDRIILTPRGFLVSNGIIERLIL